MTLTPTTEILDDETLGVYDEIVTEEVRERARDQLVSDIAELVPKTVNRLSVSEWAEHHRVLSPEYSPMPGPFRWDVNPYMREIVDCFSEDSPVQGVALMKAAQVTATVSILENIIGYIIDVSPGPTMFLSGDKEMAETSMETRIDSLIDSAGLSERIFAQTQSRHSHKTGDTKRKKEFPGGFLVGVGPNSGAKLRQISVKTILFDEVDAYPEEVGREGDPITLARKRTNAYERIRKILYLSTPLTAGSSKITELFEHGDQRHFYVPCRHCGHMQRLRFRDDAGEHRLKYEVDEYGNLAWDSVHYECEACGGHWKNTDKEWFLSRGEWRATTRSMEPNFRSYHISALYSPLGMQSWESICQEWITAQGDSMKLKAFTNTVLGETWEERGEAPPAEILQLRAEDYYVMEIPGGYFLTIGADVQKDRIEAEVVAWGTDMESWSVEYRIIEGDTSKLEGGAWRGFADMIQHYSEKEHQQPLLRVAVDASYRTDTVYTFADRYERVVYAIMGDTQSRSSRSNVYTVRQTKGFSRARVDFNTDFLKGQLYSYLQKGRPDDPEDGYPMGYCHFPGEYTAKYYRMLTAEIRRPERMKNGKIRYQWVLPEGKRNEALDCRAYAMGMVYHLAGEVMEHYFNKDAKDGIEWNKFWQLLEKRFSKGVAQSKS